MRKLVLTALLYGAAVTAGWAQQYPYIVGKPNPGGADMPAGVTSSCTPQGKGYVFTLNNTSGREVRCLYGCYQGPGKAGQFKPGRTRVTIAPPAANATPGGRVLCQFF